MQLHSTNKAEFHTSSERTALSKEKQVNTAYFRFQTDIPSIIRDGTVSVMLGRVYLGVSVFISLVNLSFSMMEKGKVSIAITSPIS